MKRGKREWDGKSLVFTDLNSWLLFSKLQKYVKREREMMEMSLEFLFNNPPLV